jgi:uncharacterized membrane protein
MLGSSARADSARVERNPDGASMKTSRRDGAIDKKLMSARLKLHCPLANIREPIDACCLSRPAVNQPISELAADGVVEIIARPHRSASISTLALVFSALVVSVAAVSAFSFIQGNVYAPLFAAFDLALVGGCFWFVWRRGDDFDRVRLDTAALRVERNRRGKSVIEEYATPWARLWAEPKLQRSALFVGSHGRRTEIGDFLADAERERLAVLMRQRLSALRSVQFEEHDLRKKRA